jgi:HSP20 family protein
VRPEDVNITVEGGTLTIRGEVSQEQERQDRNYLIREVRQGSFIRTLRLPDTIDPDRAEASFEHGVLRLRFPRSEQAKPRRISIGAGSHTAGNQAIASQSAGTIQGDRNQQAAAQSSQAGTESGAEGTRQGGRAA